MDEDLRRSALTSEALKASAYSGAGVTPWPMVEITDDLGKKDVLNMASYVAGYYTIPYWSPDGAELTGVVIRKPRFKEGAPHEVKQKKYARPSKVQVGALASVPYMHPLRLGFTGPVLDIHEGEKKTACAAIHGQCAIGIAGCNNWGDPENKGALHPWIVDEVLRVQQQTDERVKVRLWADADYKTNQNVAHAYSAFAAALTVLDVDVVLMDMSAIRAGAKFDDLVAEVGFEKVMAGVIEQPASSLPENPEALGRKYMLLSTPVGKPPRLLPQAITYNYNRLLELHPKFRGQLWLDIDRQKAMFGTAELVENIGDHELLHFFQSQLGFNGSRSISLQAMRDAILHRITLEKRSPFNDRIERAAQRLNDLGGEAMATADEALNTWALKYLRAPDTPFNRRWGRKFLMAIVNRALVPGCSMRTAFCLAGPQGIGKSYFLQSIVGESNMAILSESNTQGKDRYMIYASCIVAVHDEMVTMGGKDAASLKSDISTRTDKVRLPYARTNSDMPRRCVFYVPVDKAEFLIEDGAGMNRFAVLNLLDVDFHGGKFDFAGMEAAADDLLGAAWLAVQSGEQCDEVEGADESARGYVKTDAVYDSMQDVLEGPLGHGLIKRGTYKGRPIVGLLLNQIAEAVGLGDKTRGGATAVVTGPLTKLGFSKCEPNAEPLGHRRLWVMDAAEFDEKIKVTKGKLDG
jgi:hypothetical protein